MSRHFVSIHTHSAFSIMDATSQPHRMSRRIAELGQKGFMLTDHGNMNGFSEIQKAAQKAGIVCVPGVEFYVAVRGHEDKTERDTAHLTVWAHNLEGYRNLCRLQTKSFIDGYYYDPRIDFEMLEEYNEGLMASSGCLGGIVNKPLTAGDRKEAERRIKLLSEIFEDRFWIEIQNHNIEEELANHVALKSIATKFQLPIVAAHDSHYTDIEDYIPHDVVVCLRSGKSVNDPARKLAYAPKEFHLKSVDEMLRRHKPEHVYESGRIFDMCEEINITTKKFHIPALHKDPEARLREMALDGAKERYPKPTKTVKERLGYELDTICKAGFAPYLLLIADVYDYARKHKIPSGAGRGSAAGSVVCYCLGITNIDPIEHDLMFERFIDPNRVSQPDVDCDFSAEYRQQIIDHLKEKWGDDCVSQILTFQTMGGRAAIRDVARALGKPYELGDKLAKLIPEEGSVTRDREERNCIQAALDSVKEFKKLYDNNDDAQEIVDMAISLEGQLKATSLHAAGVVIADKPLGEYCPMVTVSNDKKGRLLATGYGMNELEDLGLLKVDILGIRYLDVLFNAVAMAKKDGALPGDFTIEDIDVHDESIYRLLSRGNTAGVFQVEGGGLTKLLRDFKPKKFSDIALAIAIFRPGPIAQIPNLVGRSSGNEKITYPHKSLEPIMRETYGLCIYQEIIIKMAVAIAGYDLTRADELRKVIAKKVVEKMSAQKADFIEAAVNQGHDRQWATDLFTTLIEPAARYAFSKSHAFAYADLTAKTAWVKANIPLYFYSALLTSVEDHPERAAKIAQYVADARDMGIAITPPDINTSELTFTPDPKNHCVRFGLSGIKNVGEKAVAEIVSVRKSGPFSDIFECVGRIKSRLVTSRAIESLVGCGAMDCLPGSREAKLASLETAFKLADLAQDERKRASEGKPPVKRKKAPPEPILASSVRADPKGMLALELDLLGCYLSGHPFLEYRKQAEAAASHSIQEAREAQGEPVIVAGILTRLTEHVTKKGKQKMYFCTLEDDKAGLSVTIFPKTAATINTPLELGSAYAIAGRVEGEDSEAQLIADSVRPIFSPQKIGPKDHTVTLNATSYQEQIADARKKYDEGWTGLNINLPNGNVIKVLPSA